MENTSLGVHTFSFFQRLDEYSYFSVNVDFQKYMNEYGTIKRRPIKDKDDKIVGWEYTYKKPKGIRWLLLSNRISDRFNISGVLIVITPRVLIDKNYIAVSRIDDIEQVEALFNQEAARISPLLMKFGSCSMSRSDPGLTIDLKELNMPCSPQQMMMLIKRGDIPYHFTERKVYDDKSHRKKTDKNSFYLENHSVVINFYWKYPKQKKKHPNYINREESYFVLRFEVQCKYPKLYALARNIKQNSKYFYDYENLSSEEMWAIIEHHNNNPTIPIDTVLSNTVAANIVRRYCNKIIHTGDYLTLDCAKWMIESYNFKKKKERRLLWILELVNECRGIAKARAKLFGNDVKEFNRSLKDLDSLLINPVTIPREWQIEHIQNPLRAYHDHMTEIQLIPYNEKIFRERLEEYRTGKCG